ncbi:hypothetical protein C8F04DRAFT_1106018 [Mycena alexandri]|uniref:Uncharacterized protein n=1 Tax=Mycena alexandri TaxID=1745969 RepID=A0AAD6SSG5_9AGAR|nr:hypothetical protein C8F04DRAFT_1106018 [Mycena alexandri]
MSAPPAPAIHPPYQMPLSHGIELSTMSDMMSLTPKEPEVEITLWRLINTAILLVLGIWKAAATYRGQSTAPATLDWIVGVLWALISYWVGIIEQENPECALWLFERDSSHVLRTSLWFLPVSICIFSRGI